MVASISEIFRRESSGKKNIEQLDHIKPQNTNFRGKSPKSSIFLSPIVFRSQICEKKSISKKVM